MDSAYLRNAETGQFFAQQPVPFVRLPAVGELISVPPQMWSVVRVVHLWTAPNNPAVEVDVSPVPATAAAASHHVNPLQVSAAARMSQ
jgi:hypothetical protein